MDAKVKYLEDELKKIQAVLNEIGASRKIIERKVVSFGNGGHVVIPKQHLNKSVKIIID